MSKLSVTVLVVCLSLLGAFFIHEAYSERSKRIELETENERITSIMDRVVKASMTTRYSMPDCFRYQSEISFLIAEYYGHQVESVDIEIFYQDSSEVTE